VYHQDVCYSMTSNVERQQYVYSETLTWYWADEC